MSCSAGVGLVGGLTPRGAASARRLTLFSSSSSSSFRQVATWNPLFSTATSTRLMSAPAVAYSTTEAAFHKLRSARVPWLVLPPQALEQQRRRGKQQGRDLDGEHGSVVTDNHFMGLLDIGSGTIVPVPVPHDAEEELLNWRWIGSSQGWLVSGDPKTNLLCLFNPIDSLLCEDSTKPSYNCIIRISLPDTYPRALPSRVVLTSPPSSSSSNCQGAKCQVFVVYESCIAFCNLNANSNSSSPPWKLLTTTKEGAGPYEDVFLDGRWLVTLSYCNDSKEVYVEDWVLDHYSGPHIYFFDSCDVDDVPVRSQSGLSQEKSKPHLLRKMYLLRWAPHGQSLECKDEDEGDDDNGDMLLVIRYVAFYTVDGTILCKRDFHKKEEDMLYHKTVAFDVCRNHSNRCRLMESEKVESLGDCALFLGYNETLAISVGDGGPIKRNSIYFSDDYEGEDLPLKSKPMGGHDCGVFDMADHVIRPLPQCDFATIRSRHKYGFVKPRPCPIWLLPTLQPSPPQLQVPFPLP